MWKFFRDVQKGMEAFGSCVGMFVNTVFLGLVYVIGVGITALLAKLMGKLFLDTQIRKEEKSYWSDLHLKKKSIEEYYRQF